jgi:hypothetical protein
MAGFDARNWFACGKRLLMLMEELRCNQQPSKQKVAKPLHGLESAALKLLE